MGMILNGARNEKLNGMIVIDLHKANGTLDHKTLLDKMKGIRFLDKTIRSIHSYFFFYFSFILFLFHWTI